MRAAAARREGQSACAAVLGAQQSCVLGQALAAAQPLMGHGRWRYAARCGQGALASGWCKSGVRRAAMRCRQECANRPEQRSGVRKSVVQRARRKQEEGGGGRAPAMCSTEITCKIEWYQREMQPCAHTCAAHHRLFKRVCRTVRRSGTPSHEGQVKVQKVVKCQYESVAPGTWQQ